MGKNKQCVKWVDKRAYTRLAKQGTEVQNYISMLWMADLPFITKASIQITKQHPSLFVHSQNKSVRRKMISEKHASDRGRVQDRSPCCGGWWGGRSKPSGAPPESRRRVSKTWPLNGRSSSPHYGQITAFRAPFNCLRELPKLLARGATRSETGVECPVLRLP